MGVYLEKAAGSALPLADLAEAVPALRSGPMEVRRFCDSDGSYQRKYHVYQISAGGQKYVLKKSSRPEAAIYQDFLQGRGFAVPEYYGTFQHDGSLWLLMEYIEGPDLRRFTQDMALASAETLSQIQNAFWNCGTEDGRFQRYWDRIHRREQCLQNEPELAAAYALFLARQEHCPRTLCSGDFLQCNGLLRADRVYLIDWGFGGILPYALDAARLIAHGSERPEPDGFPFFMDADLRAAFLKAHYERLTQKPDWNQYLLDIQLAALNEYIEFLEADLNDPQVSREELTESFYYRRARETADQILRLSR